MSETKDLQRLILPAAGYWHKRRADVPRYNFGKGAVKEFSWYFQGKSQVTVRSLKEVCRFLAKCKYMSDMELFLEEDFWQHPVTFEHLRKGDCEDHALWAWRKMTEQLKIKAELVCGKWIERRNQAEEETGHAWVNFEDPATHVWRVLETTEKQLGKMILTYGQAERRYFPEFAIDGELKTYRYTHPKSKE